MQNPPAVARWIVMSLLVVGLAACAGEGGDGAGDSGATAAAGAAPAPPSPGLIEAQGALGSGDFAGAEARLREVLETEPDNARAHSLLGFAIHQQGRYEEALAQHRKAAEYPLTRGVGLYRSGLALARLDRPDEAFDALAEAKADGTFDVTAIGLSPDAATLRDDPRYVEVFPSPEVFDRPFAEDVEILHEWRGEAQGDQYGWIARNIGDVDGDGINDVTTSAPTWGPGGSSAGKIYVYSGAGGELLWTAEGEAGDQFGIGIEAAGDVNGDGVPDVAAGAPGGNYAQAHDGRTGAVLFRFDGPEEGEALGTKVADVGDVNGDGHADILAGAPANSEAGTGAGAVYILSGRDGSVLHRWLGEGPNAALGSAGAGRVSPDGSILLVMGAPGAGPFGSGRVYVYRGLTEECSCRWSGMWMVMGRPTCMDPIGFTEGLGPPPGGFTSIPGRPGTGFSP